MKLRITALLLTLTLLFCLAGCDGGKTPEREALPVTGPLNVAVLQVGKADAIVITTETKTLVIDAGEADDGGKVLNYLNTLGRSTVDWLLITHYDRDHVGGADRVLNFSQVGEVIRPDYVGEREEYDLFVADIQELEVPERVVPCGSEDFSFMMDDVKVTVNAPAKTAYTNDSGVQQDNNFSLVVTLQHGKRVFLFAGDCEDDRLAELIASGKDLSAEFLKIPYHGNHTQFTASFIGKVHPAYAVACDSEKNPTDDETKAALGRVGGQLYETKDGMVVCQSDGETLTVTQTNTKE